MITNLKNRIFIIVAILAVLNTALIVGAILVTQRINKNSVTIRESLKILDKKIVTTENLRRSLSAFKQASLEVEKYDSYFYKIGDEIGLITDLENIAEKNKVTQNILSSNLDNPSGQKISLEISAGGDYINLFRYLKDLENYKYFITIENISFFPAAGAGNGVVQQANLRLTLSLYAKN